jgi:hypothetical protein
MLAEMEQTQLRQVWKSSTPLLTQRAPNAATNTVTAAAALGLRCNQKYVSMSPRRGGRAGLRVPRTVAEKAVKVVVRESGGDECEGCESGESGGVRSGCVGCRATGLQLPPATPFFAATFTAFSATQPPIQPRRSASLPTLPPPAQLRSCPAQWCSRFCLSSRGHPAKPRRRWLNINIKPFMPQARPLPFSRSQQR